MSDVFPPVIDIEEIRNSGVYERRTLAMLEGIAANAIDARMELLCALSAEDGEWSTRLFVKHAKRYQRLVRYAKELAARIVDEQKADWLFFKVMSHAAVDARQATLLPWS